MGLRDSGVASTSVAYIPRDLPVPLAKMCKVLHMFAPFLFNLANVVGQKPTSVNIFGGFKMFQICPYQKNEIGHGDPQLTSEFSGLSENIVAENLMAIIRYHHTPLCLDLKPYQVRYSFTNDMYVYMIF